MSYFYCCWLSCWLGKWYLATLIFYYRRSWSNSNQSVDGSRRGIRNADDVLYLFFGILGLFIAMMCIYHHVEIAVSSRQTRKIGPTLARLRVHWPNIVPYIGIHWANFSGLLGQKLGSRELIAIPFRFELKPRAVNVSIYLQAVMSIKFLH